jgi:histidyl-tRNA synthetase
MPPSPGWASRCAGGCSTRAWTRSSTTARWSVKWWGVKFSDAELAGIPFRVTIGKRGLAAGNAEVSDRATGEAAAVALNEIAGHVRKTVAHAIAGQP